MERHARLVMCHRRIVSAVWAVLFLGGMFSAGQLGDRLSLDFSLPGQPGDAAEQRLIQTYGVSTFDTYVAVVTVPEGETVEENQEAVAEDERRRREAAEFKARPETHVCIFTPKKRVHNQG